MKNDIALVNVNIGEMPADQAQQMIRSIGQQILRQDPRLKFIICPVRDHDVGKVSVASSEDRIVVLTYGRLEEITYQSIIEYLSDSHSRD